MKRLIFFIFLTAFLAACADTDNNTGSVQETQTGEVLKEQPDTEQMPVQPPEFTAADVDYEGYNFRILGYDGAAAGTWQAAAISEIIAEEETGDPINDATYKRNREIESLYNIEFGIVPVTYPNRGDFAAKFTRAVLAGEDLFDAVFLLGDSLSAALSRNNMVYDLHTVQTLDLSKSWWDQNSIKAMSINGKLSTAIGDMNLYSAFATVNIFANKQLMQDYSIDNLYQLVNDGKWTWDAMYEIMKLTADDLNGDGIIDHNDQVGLSTQHSYLYNAITSAGETMTPKDSDDIPSLAPNTEKISAIVSKIVPISQDKSTTINGDDITGYNNVFFDLLMPKFRQNEMMFFITQMMISFELRSMDADFAVLPLPKHDENQENYGTVIANSWGTYTVIPTTCTDTNRAGHILDAMGYYSQQYIMPAYYDVTVTNKIIRDDDSAEMMSIIFNNRNFDLAYLYNWGDISGMFFGISKSGNADTFISQLERNEPRINTAIQNTLDMLEIN